MTLPSSLAGLFGDSVDGSLGVLMSALAGIAAALAIALSLVVYVRLGKRSGRDLLRHGVAALTAAGLFTFVAYDMHHAALAYLGLNPDRPAVEFEIRLPKQNLISAADTQIELHTDRNQTLAQVIGARDLGDGHALLTGSVALEHRTADRIVVVSLPGKGVLEFRLRLAADPQPSAQFGPWHLADRVAAPLAGAGAPQDAYAIRYRVL